MTPHLLHHLRLTFYDPLISSCTADKKRAKTTKLKAENWLTQEEKAKHSKFQVKISIKHCFKAKKANRS